MGVDITNLAHRSTAIDGLVAVTMKQVSDERGTVRELYRASAYDQLGVTLTPVAQINVTESRRGAVRGMHGEPMTKLLTVAEGQVAGRWIDLRPESATFGVVERLIVGPGDQVLVPAGVANGFQTLTDTSQYAYVFDTEWAPDLGGDALAPIDAGVDYDWPLDIDPEDRAMISAKDAAAPTFAEWKANASETGR